MHTLRSAALAASLLGALGSTPAHAALTNVGNGMIYDSTSNITWIADGFAFTNNIAATTANPTADPYTGPLLGQTVTPPLGGAHTIAANDLSYQAALGRWVGSWWAASAWADGYSTQFGANTLSDWRLPTSTESQALISQLGAGNTGATGPFVWVPPFFWTSDLTDAANANVARPLFGTINTFSLMNGSIPRYSNVWAVTLGNVSAVPEPASWAVMVGGLGLLAWVLRRGPQRRPIGRACPDASGCPAQRHPVAGPGFRGLSRRNRC